MTNKSGDITKAIDAAQAAEKPKPYLGKGSIGASAVGGPCDAALAFAARGFPDKAPEPALKRIFRDGHRLEDIIIGDLRKAGINVLDKDIMTGRQFRWDRYGGMAVFKADGIIENGPGVDAMLVEIKSMNSALWTKFMGWGVRMSHPHYYDQVQMGMGLSGFRKCVIIGYNKDKSLYWDEIVEYDAVRWGFLLARIEHTLSGVAAKVAVREEDWRCRGCFKFDACWKNAPVEKTMRTCEFSYFDRFDNKWKCLKGCTEECGGCKFWQRWKPVDRT